MTFPQIPTNGQWQQPPAQQISSGPVGVLPQASYLYQQGGPMPYPFATQAWFNPLQEQGYQTTLQGLQHGVGQSLQNQGLAHGLMGGFGGFLGQQGMSASPGYINNIGGSFDPWNNPALDRAVQKANEAVVRDFDQRVTPGVTSNAISRGGMGSNRHGIQQGIAEQGLADALAKQTAGMYASGFDSGMNRYVSDRSNTLNGWLGANRNALTGWGMTPNMFGMVGTANMAPGSALANLGAGQSQIGQYYQGMSNQMLSEQQRLWDSYQNRPYDNLNWYANLVYGSPEANSQTKSSNNPMMGFMGGAMLGSELYNMFNGGFGNGFTPTANAAINDPFSPSLGTSWWQP